MITLLIQSRAMMADIVGVTVSGMQAMEQRGFPVHLRHGAGTIYHLPTVLKWLRADWARQVRRETPPDQKTAIDVRRKTADARKAEIEVGKLEETLGDIALIRSGLDGVMINQRTILLGLPAQIGRELDDPDLRLRVVALVDRCVRGVLEALAAYDPVMDDTGDASGTSEEDDSGVVTPPPAAAPAHGQRVGRAKTVSQPRRGRVRALAQ